jgi:hypothetical protein
MASGWDHPAARRLRLALEMFDAGEAMMRQKLMREHPGEGPDAIQRRLLAWLRHRPGAEQGDAEGRPVAWPGDRR